MLVDASEIKLKYQGEGSTVEYLIDPLLSSTDLATHHVRCEVAPGIVNNELAVKIILDNSNVNPNQTLADQPTTHTIGSWATTPEFTIDIVVKDQSGQVKKTRRVRNTAATEMGKPIV